MPKENGQTILRADLRLRALIGVAAKTSTTIEPALLLALATLLTATICYAGAAIFGRGFNELDPIMPAAGSLTCAAAILVPIALVVDRPWTLTPSLASIVALLSLSVFSTALAFIIYFRLVHTLGSIGTTAQAYLRVPIGVAIAVLFLGESLTSTAWAGLACVVAGVAAMTIPNRKCPISQPTEPQLRQ